MTKLSPRGEMAAQAVQILTKARAFLAMGDTIHPKSSAFQGVGSWVKGQWIVSDADGIPQYACAIGAVGVVGNYSGVNSETRWKASELEALRALADIVEPERAERHRTRPFEAWAEDIFAFNDYSKTTREDILAAFDLAIDKQCEIVREDAAQHSFDSVWEKSREEVTPKTEPYDSSLWTGRSTGDETTG